MAPANATCSYAGVELPVWNPEAAGYVGRQIPLSEYHPLEEPAGFTFDLNHLHLNSPYPQPDVQVGTLRWPTDASRWAVAHFVVTQTKLDVIRAAVGSANTPQPLVMDDRVFGTGGISAAMYLLPPRPLLVGTPATDDGPLWVISLVDDRFFWWQRLITIDPVPSSWQQLFEDLGTALNVTLPVVVPPGAYQAPTDRYKVYNQPACLILDSAAEAVGLKVVRGFDGSIELQSWQNARTASNAFYANFAAPQVVDGVSGVGRVMGGGRLASGDIGRWVPSRVTVVFGKTAGGVVQPGQYSYDETLSGFTIAGSPTLTLSAYYGTATGMPDRSARFTADFYATAVSGSVTNITTVTALAQRAAYDWYGWRLADVDVQLAGVVPWDLDAFAHQKVWTYDETRVTTRITREPFFDRNVYGYHAQAVGGAATTSDVLVLLTSKDYGAAPFISYSAVEVTDESGTFYTLAGGMTFGPSGTPLYHQRNLDHPVVGLTSGGDPLFIDRLSVVRARPGAGNWYFFGEHPWEDIFRRSGSSDGDGEISYLRVNTATGLGVSWADKREVRLIETE